MRPRLSYRRPLGEGGWWRACRTISVVVDNPSWVVPFAEELVTLATSAGDNAGLRQDYDDIPAQNDVAFFLGCVGVAGPQILARSRRNLVVHSSGLPHGRGFAPLAWQILAGQNEIPTCLIEAAEQVDSGAIVFKDILHFTGTELYPELRAAQGNMIVDLCLRFLASEHEPTGSAQSGESTTYRRRRAEDSELDPGKTIAQQFDLLRIVDNDNFPAFFVYRGRRYKLAISPLSVDDADLTGKRSR